MLMLPPHDRASYELVPTKALLCCRVNPLLDEAGIEHETHLFLEGENAQASDVTTIVDRVAGQVKADLIVASRSNKVIAPPYTRQESAECLDDLPCSFCWRKCKSKRTASPSLTLFLL